MRIVFTIVVLCSLLTPLLTSIGCQPNKEKAPTARAAGSAFVLAKEPGEAIPVGTAKESTKDGDDVVGPSHSSRVWPHSRSSTPKSLTALMMRVAQHLGITAARAMLFDRTSRR